MPKTTRQMAMNGSEMSERFFGWESMGFLVITNFSNRTGKLIYRLYYSCFRTNNEDPRAL